MSSNMSVGVNLLFDLVRQAASSLHADEYDIEIASENFDDSADPFGDFAGLKETALFEKIINDGYYVAP